MWQLKNNNFYYSIKWSIASKVYGHANPLSCKLCLMEKYWIIKYFDDPNLSNKKSKVISQCRHQNQILLMNIKRQYIFARYIYVIYFIFKVKQITNRYVKIALRMKLKVASNI